MQITVTRKPGWFYRWVKQLAFSLLVVLGRSVLIMTGEGRHFSIEEIHRRWAITGGVAAIVVFSIAAFFIHAFRDRLGLVEKTVLLVIALIMSASWTGYLIAADPATKGVFQVTIILQWLLLGMAILVSFAFLLVLGLLVDRTPKFIQQGT